MIREGSKVRISNNLKRTKDSFGISAEMRGMRGSIRTIVRINKNVSTRLGDRANAFRIADDSGSYWTFHENDLLSLTVKKPKPPETFDVNNLVE